MERERLEGESLFIEENIKAVWCYCVSGILEMQEEDEKEGERERERKRKVRGRRRMDKVEICTLKRKLMQNSC